MVGHNTIKNLLIKKKKTNSLLTVLELGIRHGKFQLHMPDHGRNLKMYIGGYAVN